MFVDEEQTFHAFSFRIQIKFDESTVFIQDFQQDLRENVFTQFAMFDFFLTL